MQQNVRRHASTRERVGILTVLLLFVRERASEQKRMGDPNKLGQIGETDQARRLGKHFVDAHIFWGLFKKKISFNIESPAIPYDFLISLQFVSVMENGAMVSIWNACEAFVCIEGELCQSQARTTEISFAPRLN